PMCGTATVAAALAAEGYRVIASDELTFPVFHATTRLLVGREPSFADTAGRSYEGVLDVLNGLPPERDLFADEYGAAGSPRNGCRARTYFTAENAGKIDAVRAAIRRWRASGT